MARSKTCRRKDVYVQAACPVPIGLKQCRSSCLSRELIILFVYQPVIKAARMSINHQFFMVSELEVARLPTDQ